jgi:hypothetical protein
VASDFGETDGILRFRLRIFGMIQWRDVMAKGAIAKEGDVVDRSSMSKLILYATVISGFVAAYLMYRRGESLGTIAKQAVTNPVGSLISEVKTRAKVAV